MGYFERSKGFKFYDPLDRSFSETVNAKFIGDCGRTKSRDIVFEDKITGLPSMITTIATNSERDMFLTLL